MRGLQVLQTARLALRHITEDDAPFILELLNERGFIDNIGDRGVRDLDGARGYILDGPGASYQKNGYGLWLAALKSTDEPIGMCGLVKREGLEHADIGYAFLERCWGQGYAVEAAQAVLDHAREVIGLETIVAITTPENLPSQKVLEKIGLRFAGMIKLPTHEGESAYFTS